MATGVLVSNILDNAQGVPNGASNIIPNLQDKTDIIEVAQNHGNNNSIQPEPEMAPGTNGTQFSVDSSVFSDKKKPLKGSNQFSCAICEKTFAGRGSLSNHMITHTGERQFQCEQCQKRFTRKDHLLCHLRIHSGHKPFQCYMCEKAFATASHRKVHMRNHTGERPYKCDKCSKHFICSSGLKSHMFAHTGQKQYRCTVCKRRYSTVNLLEVHMKRCHETYTSGAVIKIEQNYAEGQNGEGSSTKAIGHVKYLPPLPPLTPLNSIVKSLLASCEKDDNHSLTPQGGATGQTLGSNKDKFPAAITKAVQKLPDTNDLVSGSLNSDIHTFTLNSAKSDGSSVPEHFSNQHQVELIERAMGVSNLDGAGFSHGSPAQKQIQYSQTCHLSGQGSKVNTARMSAANLNIYHRSSDNQKSHREMPTLTPMHSLDTKCAINIRTSALRNNSSNSDQQMTSATVLNVNRRCETIAFNCPECCSPFANKKDLDSHVWVCLKSVTDKMALSLKSSKSKSFMQTSSHCSISPVHSPKCPPLISELNVSNVREGHTGDTDGNLKLKQSPTSNGKHILKMSQDGTLNIAYKMKNNSLQCQVCEKTFHCPSKLKVHKMVHSDIRPFTCKICHKSFKGRGSLHNHMIGHSGLRPFQCGQCGRTFTRKEHLNIHMRLHTGDKPFTCDFCEKRFATASHKKVHLRIHTGERPFQCDVCQMTFMTSTLLKQHMKRDHRDFSGNHDQSAF